MIRTRRSQCRFQVRVSPEWDGPSRAQGETMRVSRALLLPWGGVESRFIGRVKRSDPIGARSRPKPTALFFGLGTAPR